MNMCKEKRQTHNLNESIKILTLNRIFSIGLNLWLSRFSPHFTALKCMNITSISHLAKIWLDWLSELRLH